MYLCAFAATCAQFLVHGRRRSRLEIRQLLKDHWRRVTTTNNTTTTATTSTTTTTTATTTTATTTTTAAAAAAAAATTTTQTPLGELTMLPQSP